MIEIRSITKRYFEDTAVDNLSLTVGKGSVFGFLGPNGAGKTTTMKMMVGLVHPDEGTILINGTTPRECVTREHIGFMPENPSFYERLTGLEFLMFCGRLFPKTRFSAEAHCRTLLELLGIIEAADRPIRGYSKGMKQRLGFAQALVNEPAYLLLDEPLDGLDPIGRREMKLIIKKLRGDGTTIFFNSHILADVEEICDAIGIIHRGTLVYAGAVAPFCQGRPLEERFVAVIQEREKVIPFVRHSE
ncbi:MAG: ABC transporter ATP-binding protein [bacterium]|nr:ABC transporter ATP-binding protein [bacterium]MDZ4299566.1 ABC transporter ATP-binding protein [Candidatus Sungbacteria bacterium]